VALQDKEEFSADDRRCTLNTQMVRCGLQAVDHAFDCRARLVEIQPQAELSAGRFEIVGAMHPTLGSSARRQVRVIQCLDGLQFHPKHVLDQQVYEVLADYHVIVVHAGAALLHNRRWCAGPGGALVAGADGTE
jgi:hypothetical protein